MWNPNLVQRKRRRNNSFIRQSFPGLFLLDVIRKSDWTSPKATVCPSASNIVSGAVAVHMNSRQLQRSQLTSSPGQNTLFFVLKCFERMFLLSARSIYHSSCESWAQHHQKKCHPPTGDAYRLWVPCVPWSNWAAPPSLFAPPVCRPSFTAEKPTKSSGFAIQLKHLD